MRNTGSAPSSPAEPLECSLCAALDEAARGEVAELALRGVDAALEVALAVDGREEEDFELPMMALRDLGMARRCFLLQEAQERDWLVG